jgi:general L-amino acid transport system substrate-binding protein
MKLLKYIVLAASVAFVHQAAPAAADDGPTLKAVKQRGHVLCGVNPSRYGFAAANSQGKWEGLDVDFCRATAAAVFGDAEKVKYVPLSAVQRFPALQSGEVDMLSRTTTITLTRDAALGFNFGPVTFYTGTGFMVWKDAKVTKVDELNGASICVLPGSTTEKNIASLFKAKGMTFTPVVIENTKELVGAYMAHRCDVLSMDQAGLPGHKKFDAKNPDDHIILDGVFSKEPLAVGVRHGDDQWYDITKWVVNVTFDAEERGVHQDNVDKMLQSKDPDILNLLGVTGDLGKKLGVDSKWSYNIIKQVGSYKDIYDRSFGEKSPFKLPRGLNAQWKDGGLIYGYPVK